MAKIEVNCVATDYKRWGNNCNTLTSLRTIYHTTNLVFNVI